MLVVQRFVEEMFNSVEKVSSFMFSRTHITEDLPQAVNTAALVEKAQQRLHFLRVLRCNRLQTDLRVSVCWPELKVNWFSPFLCAVLTAQCSRGRAYRESPEQQRRSREESKALHRSQGRHKRLSPQVSSVQHAALREKVGVHEEYNQQTEEQFSLV